MRLPDPGKGRRRDLPALLKGTPELAVLVDTFEQRTHRPRRRQRAYYLGNAGVGAGRGGGPRRPALDTGSIGFGPVRPLRPRPYFSSGHSGSVPAAGEHGPYLGPQGEAALPLVLC
jgi:hypothetical protein